jgi:hypothetical protein
VRLKPDGRYQVVFGHRRLVLSFAELVKTSASE